MANTKLNSFVVSGYVSDEPVFHPKETQESVAKTTFHLKNPKIVGGKQFFNKFYVVVHGKLAKECIEHLSMGSECTVTGSANTWEKTDAETGIVKSGITIDAKEVFFG